MRQYRLAEVAAGGLSTRPLDATMPRQSDKVLRLSDSPLNSLSRRDVLWAGGLWGLNLSLGDVLKARAGQSARGGNFGRAKSVIMLYLHGGHAQQETWDPKPDGPSSVKGEFAAIGTSLPGVFVSELLPNSARMMHKLAVIRSVCHRNANHVQASL